MIAGIAATRADLTEWVYEQGLTALHLLLREDAEEIAGLQGKHEKERTHNHWGSTNGELSFGGRRIQPPGLGAHGYSRDRRPRNRQVLIGLVMVDGWPIAHHVFAGNWRDAKTVPQVLNDLNERFGLHRVVFVGDRGMVTSDSLAVVRSRKQGYLVGLQRRRREEVYRYIERASGEWIDCPGGITVSEKAEPPKTRVQEVRSEQSGVRIFVVHSDERLAYERGQRLRAMGRARAAFEALERRVRDGRLKAPEKIGAATTVTVTTTGSTKTVASASSSTPSTSSASKPTRVSTLFKPRSKTSLRSTPCAFTRT